MKETDFKHCKRDVYGTEICDEIIQKYVTEEPAHEWEMMHPQPAAYRQDMTAEQALPRFGKQGEKPAPQMRASPQAPAKG